MKLTTKQIIIHFKTKLLFLEAKQERKFNEQQKSIARLMERVRALEASQCQTK